MRYFCIKAGSVIAATTPIIPRVINTSARVKPGLMVLFSAALNGSLPAPIPRMVLKLLCPPPEKPCHYYVFHNLISFFSCNVYFCFLRKNIYFLGHALALLSLSPRKQIFFLICFYCFRSVYLIKFSFTQVVSCLRHHLRLKKLYF